MPIWCSSCLTRARLRPNRLSRFLQNKYPTVLGNRSAQIHRVELGDRGTYYRAHVGPFANADQANVLCDRLKSAGGQCLVHRN